MAIGMEMFHQLYIQVQTTWTLTVVARKNRTISQLGVIQQTWFVGNTRDSLVPDLAHPSKDPHLMERERHPNTYKILWY